jgi:recombination protein RecR
MTKLPSSLERLINEFSKLPGIGPKSAQRLAFYLLKRDNIDINSLSQAISQLKTGISFCQRCHNMAETDPCSTCSDTQRDQTVVCVVEEPMDALAIDKTNQFKGTFHILGGVLNPMDGIGPDQLNIQTLVDRIPAQGIQEVIIATNPSLEGETTAMHLAKILKDKSVRITRIARGLPMGGDLEYADEITLSRAMEGRREY